MTIPAILLAAGASRRLGQPKQLVRIDGETLLARTTRIAIEAGLGPVFVVLGAYAAPIAEDAGLEDAPAAKADSVGVCLVMNQEWEQGIASSIHAGVRSVQAWDEVNAAGARAAMLLVCDQPRLTVEHLRALLDAAEQTSYLAIVTSAYAGTAGIPAIFPASEFSKLLALTGDTGARQLLRSPDCPLVTVRFDGGEVDVDTPADLPT